MVSEHGIGPINVGMRIDTAASALGSYFMAPLGRDHQEGFRCDYAEWPDAPIGVHVLIRTDHVVGIRVDSGLVETSRHARIGFREDVLTMLYTGLEANKRPDYAHGRIANYSLQYTPDSDHPRLLIVFEIRDSIVKSYRAGDAVAVWDEGRCS